MAGDWTAIEHATPRKPELLSIARSTGRSRHECLGLAVEFWAWAETVTVDGRINAPLSSLPDLIGADLDFWRAMVRVGWLETPQGDEADVLLVPRADHWLTNGAKSRITKSRRQARWRDGDGHVDGVVDAKAPTTEQNSSVTVTGTVPPDSSGRKAGSAFSGLDKGLLRNTGAIVKWLKDQSQRPRPIITEPDDKDLRNVLAASECALSEGENPVALFSTIVSKRGFAKLDKGYFKRADERMQEYRDVSKNGR